MSKTVGRLTWYRVSSLSLRWLRVERAVKGGRALGRVLMRELDRFQARRRRLLRSTAARKREVMILIEAKEECWVSCLAEGLLSSSKLDATDGLVQVSFTRTGQMSVSRGFRRLRRKPYSPAQTQ